MLFAYSLLRFHFRTHVFSTHQYIFFFEAILSNSALTQRTVVITHSIVNIKTIAFWPQVY
jgi:hypothetical protein